MKTQVRFLFVAAALAAFAFGFAACGEDAGIYEAGTEAWLVGVQIKSAYIAVAPAPIDSFDFEDENFDLLGAPHETAALNYSTDTQAVRFYPNTSRGARVEWGIGSQDMRPFAFSDLRVPATFDADDFVYFKVTSEDGLTEYYYRYYIWVRSPVTELNDLYIGDYTEELVVDEDGEPVLDSNGRPTYEITSDTRVWATIAGPGSTHLNAGMGTLSIRLSQRLGAVITAIPNDSSSTVHYAMTDASSAVPVFGETHTFDLVDQKYLYVRITAQNTVDVALYKFRIEVDRIATVKTLTFKDTTATPAIEYAVVGLGTPRSGSYWNDIAYGNYKTADMPNAGFEVVIEPTDDRAQTEYAVIAKGGSLSSATFGTSGNVIFTAANNVLVIKVTSGNQAVTWYYKIEVELLAANFLQQPKSNYYYYYNASATAPNPAINLYTHLGLTVAGNEPAFSGAHGAGSVAALTVTLDRSDVGMTYQWYHANSWYGAYGFDKEGHVGYVAFDGPEGARQEHWDNFIDDQWHRSNLDEKGNTSLFNGGNWFVYPVPGEPIPGATSASYSPPVANKTPLIGNTTSASHYYWVVITDAQGRKATSKRATIITEWDPSKKHYIIDLDRDLWEMKDSVKVEYSARNPKVFTRHREKYTFPIALTSDFDVTDYSYATAQALFFLKDGTPWIQNWTQGDIGFEDDAGPIVLYYNLTNNNATLGLVGGGKEPSGGTLDKKPTKITIKPAGEKPPTAMPADILPASLLDANGMPKQREAGSAGGPQQGDAQGWFTGFIELVELHFEGPAQ